MCSIVDCCGQFKTGCGEAKYTWIITLEEQTWLEVGTLYSMQTLMLNFTLPGLLLIIALATNQ